MNAYDVLIDHHNTLRGLCKSMKSHTAGSTERQQYIDALLLELDIHFRIEDDLFYPAFSEAGGNTLVAIAHGEHRQIFDQLAAALRTPPTAANYEDEWELFTTTLDAHAAEEERDMIPAPVPISDETLERVGHQMRACLERLRHSPVEKLHVKTRAALLRAM